MNSLLAARAQMIRTLKVKYGDEFEETALLSKLMAYCSKEAHSCVEKAAMIGFVKLRILEPDQNCRSVSILDNVHPTPYLATFSYFCINPRNTNNKMS